MTIGHTPTGPSNQAQAGPSEPLGGETMDELTDDRGYILVQSVLLLVPLLIFSAFAIDIGAWYVDGQKMQRTSDAAALAGVVYLPDFDEAESIARATAARNGLVDATPGDNTDFETGPLPQIRVTAPDETTLLVEVRRRSSSYFGRFVLDSIVVERYGFAQHVRDVYMGNPTSGLGTGTIDSGALGLPGDRIWLALTAYCSDHEQGDPFAVGYYDGPTLFNGHRTCGTTANFVTPEANVNPTFDDEAYAFVVEYQDGTPSIDIDVYEPGVGCSEAGATGDDTWGPVLYFEIYGPSSTTEHRDFIDNNTPSVVHYPFGSCIDNSPSGDGWWSLLDNAATPGSADGFYYVVAKSRNPTFTDPYPGDSFWNENGLNNFSLRVLRSGDTGLCIFSSADATCPQIYALDWLPLYREIPSDETEFFLAEVSEAHAGEEMIISFFDAAEGIENLQFVDSNGTAMPFEWRYADQSEGQLTGSDYDETSFSTYTDTCTWLGSGSNPCLNTSNRDDWNDHFVEIKIDLPDDYTCGADCWWKIRYNTGASATDRSGWAIELAGDPVRLLE